MLIYFDPSSFCNVIVNSFSEKNVKVFVQICKHLLVKVIFKLVDLCCARDIFAL